jgi:hypothetical protein
MPKKKKIIAIQPQKGAIIQPRIETEKNWDQYEPIFSLHNIHGNFCISSCSDNEKVQFADWLYKLTRLTWNQIKSQNRHKGGYEQIRKTSLKAPLHAEYQEKKIIFFHAMNFAPIGGFREGRIFHIIWVDPKFKAYKHK